MPLAIPEIPFAGEPAAGEALLVGPVERLRVCAPHSSPWGEAGSRMVNNVSMICPLLEEAGDLGGRGNVTQQMWLRNRVGADDMFLANIIPRANRAGDRPVAPTSRRARNP